MVSYRWTPNKITRGPENSLELRQFFRILTLNHFGHLFYHSLIQSQMDEGGTGWMMWENLWPRSYRKDEKWLLSWTVHYLCEGPWNFILGMMMVTFKMASLPTACVRDNCFYLSSTCFPVKDTYYEKEVTLVVCFNILVGYWNTVCPVQVVTEGKPQWDCLSIWF